MTTVHSGTSGVAPSPAPDTTEEPETAAPCASALARGPAATTPGPDRACRDGARRCTPDPAEAPAAGRRLAAARGFDWTAGRTGARASARAGGAFGRLRAALGRAFRAKAAPSTTSLSLRRCGFERAWAETLGRLAARRRSAPTTGA